MFTINLLKYISITFFLLQLNGCSTTDTEPPEVERKDKLYYSKEGTYILVNVKSGERLKQIAVQHRVSVAELIRLNKLDPSSTTVSGTYIKLPYRSSGTEVIEESGYPTPQPPPHIDAYNQPIPSSEEPFDLNDVKNPLVAVGAAGGYKLAHPLGNEDFMWPAEGRVNKRFDKDQGGVHEGITIAMPFSTSVRAASTGTVVYSGSAEDYGNLVIIEHHNRIYTGYAYNSKIMVKKGQKIEKGSVIAESGYNGDGQTQLFFSVRKDETEVDPEKPLSAH